MLIGRICAQPRVDHYLNSQHADIERQAEEFTFAQIKEALLHCYSIQASGVASENVAIPGGSRALGVRLNRHELLRMLLNHESLGEL